MLTAKEAKKLSFEYNLDKGTRLNFAQIKKYLERRIIKATGLEQSVQILYDKFLDKEDIRKISELLGKKGYDVERLEFGLEISW